MGPLLTGHGLVEDEQSALRELAVDPGLHVLNHWLPSASRPDMALEAGVALTELKNADAGPEDMFLKLTATSTSSSARLLRGFSTRLSEDGALHADVVPALVGKVTVPVPRQGTRGCRICRMSARWCPDVRAARRPHGTSPRRPLM